MIKHAALASNYTDVYFYVFSYAGLMGNVNVTIKGTLFAPILGFSPI